jgi:predicted HAD superfamily Cof-like phosphohydrolase
VSAATNSGDKDFSFAVRDLHLRVQQAMDKGEDWWLVADTGAKP